MLKPRILLTAMAGLLALATSAFADTVILNNGEKVEGKILSESDTEVVVEHMSGTIRDERTIKKTDVKEIKKIPPDVIAWAALKGVNVGDESHDPADYAASVVRFKAFTTSFPKSANVAEANTRIAALEEEKKRVEAGEIKLDGKWLSKTELEQERVQIDGKLLFRRMQKQAAASQLTDAMNTFDAMEKRANGSASFPDAVLLGRQVLISLKYAVEQQKNTLKAHLDENKRRLDNLTGANKQQLEAAHKSEAAQIEAAVVGYERTNVKWMPLNPSTDRTLGALANRVASETGNLNRYPVEKMKESLAAVETTKKALADDDFAAAEENFKKVSVWTQNEFIKRLQPQMAEAKTKAAAAKVSAEKAAAEAKLAAEKTPPKKPGEPTAAAGAAAEPVPVEEPKKVEKPFYASPIFWVSLLLVLALAAGSMKAARKIKEPAGNITDF
jgi:hypothetical protein